MKFMVKAGALVLLAAVAALPQLRFEKAIELPGVSGRIDHLAFNPATQVLYVAALGNNTLEAVDLRAGKHLRSVPGFHEPQGIAYVPGLNRIFVANGGDGKLAVIDAGSFKEVASADFGGDADNVRYDAAAKRIWVGYAAGALGEIDAASAKRLGDVKLAAHPESFQLEKSGPRIFVNVPNARHIAVIDRERRSVIAKWPVEDAAANYPMALDEAGHRLFIGCRKPPSVLVYDTASGKKLAQFACVGDTDDLFYDAARQRLYVAGGEGLLWVFDSNLKPLAKIPTAAGARTGLWIPELSVFCLAAPHRGNQRAEIRVYRAE